MKLVINIERDSESNNKRYLHLFMIMLSARLLIEFLSAFLGVFAGISSTSYVTIVIYVAMLFLIVVVTAIKKKVNIKSVLFIICIYIFFYVSYRTSSLKELYLDKEMLIIYIFYIPFSFLILRNITNWEQLTVVAKKYILGDLILALMTFCVSVLYSASRLTTNSSYMSYSYTILPILCIAYLIYKKERNIIYLLLVVVDGLSMFIYGARMSIFFLTVFIVMTSFKKASKFGRIIYVVILGVTFLFGMEFFNNGVIILYLNSLGLKYGSHILTHLTNGTLFVSSGREIIYAKIENAIRIMPINGYGIFGDRLFVSSYSHSIFLESIISFGWFWGIVFLLVVFILTIRGFIYSIKKDIFSVYLLAFICFFCKLFVSSSFVSEWGFYVFVGITMSVIKGKIIKEGVRNENSFYSNI